MKMSKRAYKASSDYHDKQQAIHSAHAKEHREKARRLELGEYKSPSKQLDITLADKHRRAARLHESAMVHHKGSMVGDKHSTEAHEKTQKAHEYTREAEGHNRAADHPAAPRYAAPAPIQPELEDSHEVHERVHGHKQEYHRTESAHARAEGNSKAAQAHTEAATAHSLAQDYREDKHPEASHHSNNAWRASKDAKQAGRPAKIQTMHTRMKKLTQLKGFGKSQTVIDALDSLIKADKSGKVIGRTADGKEVYACVGGGRAAGKDTLKKKKDPKEKKKLEDEEEMGGEGTHEHHRDRALAHLQAAQAHASAAGSAKKVEAAKEHKQIVGQARQASEATMQKSLFKNNIRVDLSAENTILEGLENGTYEIGGQSAGLKEDGRNRLLGMREERLNKGGIAGGTIYQGEHSGPRGCDDRESVARAQCYADMIEIDGAGNQGQGGLGSWFRDAWGGQLKVNVPVGATKVIKAAAPGVHIIDDVDDPYQKALATARPTESQAGIITAYKGRDCERYNR
jgi:hypothetical protein